VVSKNRCVAELAGCTIHPAASQAPLKAASNAVVESGSGSSAWCARRRPRNASAQGSAAKNRGRVRTRWASRPHLGVCQRRQPQAHQAGRSIDEGSTAARHRSFRIEPLQHDVDVSGVQFATDEPPIIGLRHSSGRAGAEERVQHVVTLV